MNAPAKDVKALECPCCGGAIELRAAGFSTYFVCQYCGSELDLLSDNLKALKRRAEAAGDLHIPLGTRGVLKDIEWVVTGNLRKSDGWEEWEEFLLFNPYHGYRWLVFTKDGWSYGTPLLSAPEASWAHSVQYQGNAFSQCYDIAFSETKRALGEFYWQAKRGDRTQQASYVCGQLMLSCEYSGDEQNWTLEQWVDSAEVAQAFGVYDTGQYPEIGSNPLPHQPNPYKSKAIDMSLVASVFFLAAILLAVILSFGEDSFSEQYTARIAASERMLSLGQFTVAGRSKPFTIETRGEPGNNNWMDVEYTLTNTATGDQIIANQPIEYYFGKDWKEDNRFGTIKISGVPEGTYDLTAQVYLPEDHFAAPSRTAWDTDFRTVSIKARPNGFFSSNLFLLFLGLFAPAIWYWCRSNGFEGARSGGFDGGEDDD